MASTTAARTFTPPRSTPRYSSSRFMGPRPMLAGFEALANWARTEPLGQLFADVGHRAFDQALDLAEPRLAVRLPAQHQQRLRVGGAHQPPSTVDDHAHAVDLDGLAVLAQPLLRELHGAELLLLREVESDLRRRESAGNAVEHAAQRPAIAGDQLQQPGGGVDAVVESEVAVAE